jgi:hypothetical protein
MAASSFVVPHVDVAFAIDIAWRPSMYVFVSYTPRIVILIGVVLVLGQMANLFPDGYGENNSPFVASASEVAVRFALGENNKVTGFDLFIDAYEEDEPADKPTLVTIHAHFVKSTGNEDVI